MATTPVTTPPETVPPSSLKGTGKFVCDKCGRHFKAATALGGHKRTIHGIVGMSRTSKSVRNQKGAGKFVCDVKGCGRHFKAAAALGFHKRATHGIVGKYSLKHQKQLARKHHVPKIKRNYAPVVPENGKGMFVCPECGQEFRFAKALGKHRSAKHGVAGTAKSTVQRKARLALQAAAEPEESGVVLTCAQCGKGPFKSHSGLMIHQTTQHGKGGVTVNGNGTGNTNDEVAIAFWISRTATLIEQLIATHAHRVNLTAEDFTARCMAVLSGSSKTLRERYRLSDRM